MKKSILTPRTVIESKGKLSYNESTQAWATLRFKSEIVKEFRQLKEKRSKFSYKLMFYRDYGLFEKFIKELIKKKDVLPVLIWFEKEFE